VSKPTWAVLQFLAVPCLAISRQAASEDAALQLETVAH